MKIYMVMPMPVAPTPSDEDGAEACKAVNKFFRSHDMALAFAKRQAQKNPGIQVVVIGPVQSVLEAKEPEIIEKEVSETGEITVKVPA